MRRFFLFATLAEARFSIKEVGASCEGDGVFAFGDHRIVIVGMGPKKASLTVEKLPTDQCVWVNIGIAGAIDRSIPVGRSVCIGSTAFLCAGRVYDHHIVNTREKTLLYTSPVPVYQTPVCCDTQALIDMEGHAIAKVACQKNVPFSLIKVVSDYCSEGTHQMIAERIEEFSKLLSTQLQESIHRCFES